MDQPLILVVEDNPVLQKVLSLFAAKYGVVVHIVGSGEEALLEIVEQPYNLILMDWKLPDMDGLDCTRRLRENGCRMPIIAMTANVFSEHKQSCLDAGMNDYMAKPFTGEQFRSMVYRWLLPEHLRKAQ